MAHPLRLFNQGGYTSSFIALIFLAQMLVNTCLLLYALETRVVYGFGIRLRGMCEVTPYMEATTASKGISVIYHTLQCYISYIPRRSALIFTSSVVRITIKLNQSIYQKSLLCSLAHTKNDNHIMLHCIYALQKDIQSLIAAFKGHGNLFLEKKRQDLLVLDTRYIVDSSIGETVLEIEAAGSDLYAKFMKE